MKALILIAHGSRKELSNTEFKNFTELIKKEKTSYDLIEASFLELATPSIQDVTKEFIQKGAKEIYYYPFFLNTGKHVANDIPKIINDLQDYSKDAKLILLSHFGKSDKIMDIVLNDIEK